MDVHDWIAELGSGQRVLDLGSGAGSFPTAACRSTVVTLDEDAAVRPSVCGRGQRIPFRDGSFDLVVCHHSLEHIAAVDETLAEIGRVLSPGGRCFIAVPDGYGLCDAVYRWVFDGGGHVNRFRRAELAERIERVAGVRLVGWQKLYSSFAYLRRAMELLDANPPGLAPRLKALRRLPRACLGGAQHLLYIGSRLLDTAFGTDKSVYGWALFFERGAGGDPPVELSGYVNVCPYCGVGQAWADLARASRWRCQCPSCFTMYRRFRPYGTGC